MLLTADPRINALMAQFFHDAYTDDGYLRVDMMERARKVFKNTISDEGIRTFYHDRWLDWHYPRGGSVI
jgi:hypothetical protein